MIITWILVAILNADGSIIQHLGETKGKDHCKRTLEVVSAKYPDRTFACLAVAHEGV